MARRGGRADRVSDGIAVALLGATFVVVALLLVQAALAVRAHARMVDATLRDAATFAAERIASDLDVTLSAIFLDEIAATRSAFYAWLERAPAPDGPPSPGSWSLPEGAVQVRFALDGARAVSLGGALAPETAAWILEQVVGHAEEVYPRPAPYAVLRPGGPQTARAVVYRKEDAYERAAVYGFVVELDRLGPVYERVLGGGPVLPSSFAGAEDPGLVRVALGLSPDGPPLHLRGDRAPTHVVTGGAFAAKAGRLSVRVELDAEAGRALVRAGSPAPGVPLLSALALLTVGLLAAAVALQRRAARLTRMREAFVANVSHDLRTPLAQIRMFSETLLLDRMGDGAERRRALEIIRQQAEGLSDLVENVLHLSGRGAAPVRPAPTDLETLLADTLAALGPAAAARGARLRHRVIGPGSATIDRAALRRIVVNLVDNALKYGPRDQAVTVTAHVSEDAVDVVVDDEGRGVPARERVRIWERFRRLDEGERVAGGTGLGLAVVRDLAERHGGSVRFEDAPGGGARVVVRLAGAGAID